jgi:hypothetical protein
MPNEIRVRQNFAAGTITDAPLSNVATVVNSAAFASLPAIGATQHLPIVLDPAAAAGAPEIVWVTAHTAGATTATVLRGRGGTTARQHAAGTVWRHTPMVDDYVTVATSTTRPATDLYEGRLIYETDTDLLAVYTGTAWQYVSPSDSGWIPIASFVNGWSWYSGATYGSNEYNFAAYRKRDGIVYLRGLVGGGTATSGTIMFTLPAGYRPQSGTRIIFPVSSNDAFGAVSVLGADGTVRTHGVASSVYVSLTGVVFPADA